MKQYSLEHLKVVRDAGKKVERTVHAAESIAGGIQVRNRGVVVLPFHKEPPFLSREHFQSNLASVLRPGTT